MDKQSSSVLFYSLRSVFGSVSGRSSPESISEDLQEPSSSFHDKFSSNLGGKDKKNFTVITDQKIQSMLTKKMVVCLLNDILSLLLRSLQSIN